MHPLMDSSTTNFLEEEENETMHSEVDVDAITVALNKDSEICGQPANEANRWDGMQVPFGLLLPDIQPQLDKDRAIQLQGLYNRLKINNINKKEFVRHMRTLVGDHMIKMALYKLHRRGQLSAKQNTQKSSAYVATSSIHQSSDSKTLPLENISQKTRLLEHQSDSHGLQHMDFPQSSFSTYGNPSGNYHTGASPNTNTSSLSLQIIQGPIHPIRMHQGGPTQFPSNLPNLSHWQPSMHKDQSLMSSMVYGESDHMVLINEQQKSQVSTSKGPPSFSQGQHKQANRVPPRSITAQLESQMSAGNLSSAVGSNAKTPPKKSTVALKKPLEVPHVSSLSKKQKTCGAFSDQSIEQFNDVTALSGVNLREEEEQLFSRSKEDSRASEASRMVVQEEDERLFLQKVPLQKKVSEIMAKCGVKNRSNDVERCMSQCVERRMYGLITNLIRLSKQRANIEKPRHRIVITSDIRQQIMSLNKKAREESDEKQADADKLKIASKVNKEEEVKVRTTDANVAARAAVGGDDMLLKWQISAEQARQKRESRPDAGLGPKPVPTSERNSNNNNLNADLDKSGDSIPLPRTVSVKDVISVLEREIQMSRSTMIHHLYEKV